MSRALTARATGLALLATAAGCAAHNEPPRVATAPPVITAAALPTPPAETPNAPKPRIAEEAVERQTPDADFRETRPAAGPERPFKVPKLVRLRFGNGLRVILVESHKLPLLTVDLVVRTGSAANPADKAGLAELVANMLDEGTKTRTAPQISREVEQLGARLATFATWDASTVTLSCLTETADKALPVWADVAQHPSFADAELDRVRANLLASLERRKDSPPAVAGVTFARVLFGENHPYGWPGTGMEASLKRITARDLRTFFEAQYRPNNAVLVVAGDMTAAQVRSTIEPLFKGWRAGAAPTPKLARPAPLPKTKIVLVDKAGAPQSSVRIGLVALPRKHPDYYKALVTNEILGGSFRRLDLDLREKKGWTYGARSGFDTRRTPGPWFAGGEFVAAHTADAVAAVVEHVKGMRNADVPDDELREVKDSLIKAFPARFATLGQIAGQIEALAVYDLPDDELAQFTKRIEAVTKQDVRRMAQTYFDPSHLAIVVVGDERTTLPELKKLALGDVELRNVDGDLIKP